MLLKGLLKRMIIPALTSPPLSTFGSWLFGQGTPVFMIHRMNVEGQNCTGIKPDYLRRCLQYLSDEGYQFISLEEIIRALLQHKSLPEKSVAFTLDDGLWDQAEIAAPIFVEFNCPATFFIITGMLDNNLWPWDAKVSHLINTTEKPSIEAILDDERFNLPLSNDQEKRAARNIIRNTIKTMAADRIDHCLELLAEATACTIPQSPPAYLKPMDWDAARRLEAQGIRFSPHTQSHRILSKLDAVSAENEIMTSWRRVQDELASPSPVFAYPTGRFCDYGPREIAILKKTGFIGAVSTIPGTVTVDDKPLNYEYNLPRLSLPDEFSDFIKRCSWMETAKPNAYYFT